MSFNTISTCASQARMVPPKGAFTRGPHSSFSTPSAPSALGSRRGAGLKEKRFERSSAEGLTSSLVACKLSFSGRILGRLNALGAASPTA
ncbi:hypothetical protein HYQ44_003148 [Verticillium longisporum]|nr:hypothetical protein HYQ44_003148 [Verticillium longisporum]